MKTGKNKFRLKVGKKIAVLRKKEGLCQKDLAILLNCSLGHLGAIESGWTSPSLDKLYKICVILKCDIFYFLPSVTGIDFSDFICTRG